MILESREAGLESVLALSSLVENNENDGLSGQESENNMADNLVSVVGLNSIHKPLPNGSISMETKGVGTGLMLTTDGFVLTAYHNIQSYENDWNRIRDSELSTTKNVQKWMERMRWQYAIIDQNNESHPIDVTLWATAPALDIAIIKAVIFEKPEPIRFNMTAEDSQI